MNIGRRGVPSDGDSIVSMSRNSREAAWTDVPSTSTCMFASRIRSSVIAPRSGRNAVGFGHAGHTLASASDS